MSHPHLKHLDLSLSWIDGVGLRVINSALCLTRLKSLSIFINDSYLEEEEVEEEEEEEEEWDYELYKLQFMTNLKSLTLTASVSDILFIKDDKIFSSLTKLTYLSYSRDHSCNSDDNFTTLTNLKTLYRK
jgi:hypothetical protein